MSTATELNAFNYMLTHVSHWFSATLDLTDLALIELNVCALKDNAAHASIDLLGLFIECTNELQEHYIKDVRKPHEEKGHDEMQLDIKLVSRLLAILLQMRRNHDWLRNTMGSEELLTREPGEPIANALGAFFFHLEGMIEDCMRSFDTADCSHGSMARRLDCRYPIPMGPMEWQDPVNPETDEDSQDTIFIEENTGQTLDFDM